MGEVKQKTQRQIWCANVWKLIRIRLRQYRKFYFGMAVLLTAGMIFDIVVLMLNYQQSMGQEYIYKIGTVPYYVAFLLVIIFNLNSYNILSDNRISMYPGTVMSRFCARLCSDYLFFWGLTVVYGLLYIVSSAVLNILAAGNQNFDVSGTFSPNYLGAGMLQMFCGCLFLHSLFVLGYVFITKFGFGISVLLLAFGILITNILIYNEKLNLYNIWDVLIGRDWKLGGYLVCILSVWGISTMASFIITTFVRRWKRTSVYVLVLLVIGGLIGGGSCIQMTKSVYDYQTTFPQSQYHYQNKALAKDFSFSYHNFEQSSRIINYLKNNTVQKEKEDYGLDFRNVAVVTEKEAKKNGYVEEDFALKGDEMILRVAASDVSYRNKYINENALQCLEIYQKGFGNIYWKREKCANVFSVAFGTDYRKCKDVRDDQLKMIMDLWWWPNSLDCVLIVDQEVMTYWNGTINKDYNDQKGGDEE